MPSPEWEGLRPLARSPPGLPHLKTSLCLERTSTRSGGRRKNTLASRSSVGRCVPPEVTPTASQASAACARMLAKAHSAVRKKLRSDSRRVRRIVLGLDDATRALHIYDEGLLP